MEKKFRIERGIMQYPGVTLLRNGLNIVYPLYPHKECGILLKERNCDSVHRIVFDDCYRTGDLYCVCITDAGINWNEVAYSFFEDAAMVPDKYARKMFHNYAWNETREEVFFTAEGMDEILDWTEDQNPQIPYEDCVIYCLHVRGFTRHSSSKCRAKGTFKGLTEKIPYLRELGINVIEALPVYEFDEKEHVANASSYMAQRYRDASDVCQERINYWGFRDAFYMMPKAAYCATDNPQREFAQMIQKLHRAGMEFVMQIYFPEGTGHSYILEVLKYWKLRYHVDGFHLMGQDLPIKAIFTEPLFSKTKLLSDNDDLGFISVGTRNTKSRNIAAFSKDFFVTGRSYLKGDCDTLERMFDLIRRIPEKTGKINYLSNYNTFTMMDMVSYDRKHNEANGENNRDGTEYNYSWNCGVEGVTRRKDIRNLRMKMIKNAYTLLIFAAGTPFLIAGDEFGFSHEGNNNPYCQDNEVNWLNWKLLQTNKELMNYLKEMLLFRKNHAIFRRKREFTLMDSLGCAYPDLSVHSDEPWKAKLENYNHSMGLMYCGRYAGEDEDIYIAYNMYWQRYSLALPKLPENKKWYTWRSSCDKIQNEALSEIKGNSLLCEERSVYVLIGKKNETIQTSESNIQA